MGKKVFWILVVLVVCGVGFYAYKQHLAEEEERHAKFAKGNGRMEATEVYITTRLPGRIDQILVKRGTMVKTGDALVKMDIRQLEAQKASAQARRASMVAKKAQVVAAQNSAVAVVKVRESEVKVAEAIVEEKKSKMDAAQMRFKRTEELFKREVETAQKMDDDRADYLSAKAAYDAAVTSVEQAKATLAAAEADAKGAEANIQAAQADIDSADADIQSIEVDIRESTLVAPRDGRIQYEIAQAGEVIAAGGRVLNLTDLTDVYMSFFLPAFQAGRIKIGAEARIVLDAMPDYPVPATVSYVASTAQFTPKTVETAAEREKMMFRIEVKIDPELLKEVIDYVKTGLPGEAWVKMDETAEWPQELQVKYE